MWWTCAANGFHKSPPNHHRCIWKWRAAHRPECSLSHAKLNKPVRWGLSPMTRWYSCVYARRSGFQRKNRTTVATWKVHQRFHGLPRSVNAYPWIFSSFVALYWIMTEWERSHRDKGEGGQIEQGQARKGSRWRGEGRGGIRIDVICDDCHRGGSWVKASYNGRQ